MGTTGHEALADALRADLPDGFGALSEDDATRLAETLTAARRRQAEELAAAADDALGHLPRPLRGPVRKLVGL